MKKTIRTKIVGRNIGKSASIKDWGKYKGSIVMTVDDRIYTTKNPKKVSTLLQKIEKKHHKRPLITVIPKEDTLILVIS